MSGDTAPSHTATLPRGAKDAAGPGDVLLDRYVLESQAGEGALLRVFAALDIGACPPRRVAVKAPARPELWSVARRRLEREAALLARVHALCAPAGIVRRVGMVVEHHRGMPLLTAELIEGPSLREALEARRGSGLGLKEALRIGAALGRALAALHAAGVVLGDLKPENVVLRGGTEPVIVDLGAARLAGAGAEERGEDVAWMTPAYAAPEQRAGDLASPASDVYSLGLLVIEMASGEAPPPGRVDCHGGPASFAAAARRLLAADPAARPPAEEAARCLEAVQSSPWAARRGRTVAVVAAALLCAAAVGRRGAGPALTEPSPPVNAPVNVPVRLAGAQPVPLFMAPGSRYVFWHDRLDGSFLRAPSRGGAAERLLQHRESVNGLAAEGDTLFWSDAQGAVWAFRDGAAVELHRRRGVTGGIAADAGGVVWSDWTGGAILALGPGGKGPVRVIVSGQDHPEAIAMDEAHVAFCNHGDGSVRAAPRAGGEARTIARGQARPIRMAMYRGDIYWVNNGDGTVMRAPSIEGGGAEVVARSVIGIRGLAVDRQYVYWTAPDDGQVWRAPVAGGAPELLAARQGAPFDVAVDEGAIYWTTGAEDGAVMMLKKPAPGD